MSDNARLKSTLYVGGLDQSVTKDVLHAAFIPFGEVVDVSIPAPEAATSTERHRGFGYVEYELPQDAQEAIENMDQSELFGRVIKVAQAKPQKEANEGLGSKIAVWEQEGWLSKHGEGDKQNEAAQIEEEPPEDPMQGLDRLDVAGPRPE